MNAYLVASIVLACICAATGLGMRLNAVLPRHHLSPETKDAVRIGMGLVATMAAMILGLLVASAKGSYDTEKGEVTQMAVKFAFLDRVLVNYGPETQTARQALRQAAAGVIARIWAEAAIGRGPVDPGSALSDILPKAIQKLSPQDDAQRTFKSQAAAVANDLGQMRWLLFEQTGSSISTPLLIMVVSWLTIIFGSVGLFAPRNPTVVGALMLAALAVSGAIFLILELDQPFGGLIQISDRPILNVLDQLAK